MARPTCGDLVQLTVFRRYRRGVKYLPFHWHIMELVIVAVVGWLHVTQATSRRGRGQLLAAYGVLLLVTLWPLGELAAKVSLTGATVQRLLIMLLVLSLIHI